MHILGCTSKCTSLRQMLQASIKNIGTKSLTSMTTQAEVYLRLELLLASFVTGGWAQLIKAGEIPHEKKLLLIVTG